MMRCFTLLLLLLLLHTPSSTSLSVLSLCNHHDNSNLLQLKNSFAIKPSRWYDDWCFSSYPKIASWKNGTDCCEWDGVTCDTTSGHVIGLDLSCSMLEGEFHPNTTLFQLTHLQQLNLAFNNFSKSPIYPGIGNLVSLTHLNLSWSSFSSHIPSTISHLSKLLSLDLSYNYDEPTLDESTWSRLIGNTTNLEELVLDCVDMSSIRETSFSLLMNLSSSLLFLHLPFTGLHGRFPTRILGLTNLEELSLNGNEELKGELPKSNWSTPLRILDLSWTAFSEEIPDSISHLKSLNQLGLQHCQFDGLIPVSLWNLTQLTQLDISVNRLLHGEIPSLLSNLKHLTYLDLSGNAFCGHIPDVFHNFTKLDYLDLSFNSLGGQLPSSLLDLTQLSFLSLSSNQLIGPIPSKNATLSKLETLLLSNNFINGTIPDWCYSLPSLIMLDLSMNQFTGPISKFFTYSLEYLVLSDNKFQGDFPNSIFEFLKNLTDLYMSSNDLSGLVNFFHFSKLKNLNFLDFSNNKFLSVDINSKVNYVLPKLESLYFSSCNITVFPPFLSKLQNLRSLDLHNNKIHGKIPNWFSGNLLHTWKSMHYIDLSFNNLQGDLPIPPYDIHTFSVSNNNFTGHIPSTFFNNVSSFNTLILSHNHLSGTIPSMFCNVTFPYALILSHNHLSGVIPQCLGAFPDLTILDLQVNNLHGNIPTNFSQDNYFQTIKLNNNQLEGSLPRSLSNCGMLEVLDLAENNIEDVFPSWLEGLLELQVLSLRANKFHGTITSFGAKHPFPMLRIFDVSNNKFSGPLPTSFFENFQGMKDLSNSTHHPIGSSYMDSGFGVYNDSVVLIIKGQSMELVRILTTFTTIDLSNNMFEGEIPHVIGELSSLIGLNLSHNKISGMIPITLGNLTSLEWLDLSWNQLTGEIPMAFEFSGCLEPF